MGPRCLSFKGFFVFCFWKKVTECRYSWFVILSNLLCSCSALCYLLFRINTLGTPSRYVALNMLMRAITVDAQAVQRHRATILECVKVYWLLVLIYLWRVKHLLIYSWYENWRSSLFSSSIYQCPVLDCASWFRARTKCTRVRLEKLVAWLFSFQDLDASIRKRALELVYVLVNESNVKPLTKELIDYLEVSDQDFKGDLTAKICSLVKK